MLCSIDALATRPPCASEVPVPAQDLPVSFPKGTRNQADLEAPTPAAPLATLNPPGPRRSGRSATARGARGQHGARSTPWTPLWTHHGNALRTLSVGTPLARHARVSPCVCVLRPHRGLAQVLPQVHRPAQPRGGFLSRQGPATRTQTSPRTRTRTLWTRWISGSPWGTTWVG